MCDCKRSIERRLEDRAREMYPEASRHEVRLTGYAFIFGEAVTLMGVMPFKFAADFPLKRGGTKRKVEKTSMMFTFCPFCGVKYDAHKEDPEETTA